MKRDKLVTILGAALFLSLTANLFMGGIMAGNSYGPGREGEARHAEWRKRDEELRRQLSEPDRKILKAAMQEHRPQFQALRQELEAARQKVDEAQGAEPFDPAALEAALRTEQEKKKALLQTMRQTRDAVARQLSPEGRALFNKLGPGALPGRGEGRNGPGRQGVGRPFREPGEPPPDGPPGPEEGGPPPQP